MSSDEIKNEVVAAPASEEAPKKRVVRRTRKAAAKPEGEAAASQAASPAEAESAAPKRRGRPRKADADKVEAPESAPQADKAERAKAPAAAKDEAPAAAKAETPAQPASADDAAERPAPRRRTRRTTKIADSQADAASDASAAPAAAPEQAARAEEPGADSLPAMSGTPARKRPGRSVKVDASASDAAEGEGASKEERPRRQRSDKDDSSERPDRPEREGKSDASSEKQERRDRKDRNQQRERNQQRDRRQNGGKQSNGQRQNNNGQNRNNDQHRRQRRSHANEPIVPKTTAEDLAKLKVAELREKAVELELDPTGLKKAELVEKVLEASVRAEGFIEVEGVLDVLQDGYGFLRTKGYLPSESDVYVGLSAIRRNGLRKGDMVRGQTRPKRDNEKYAALQQVLTVNGTPVEELGTRVKFGDLTPVFPDECLIMEHGRTTITARVIDLVSPIGKGQRGLIVSPPKAGKTTVLKDIAAAITANNPEVHLMCLLVDERPEEVTDMQRSIKGEVIASTFDMPTENHIAVSELVIERAKRLVERGEDVVVLLDSLTRLARAYNLAQPASGRILSGGVDSTALYPPKRFLGAARNIEGGGSLTILASALIETGSKMDEVIFEEFKGTGNMELKLDRTLADRRIFPAIDPVTSGTRKEDLLLNPQEAPLIWAVRRILANMNNTERAMDTLIKSLKQTSNNQEFLLRTAKKAQTARDSDSFEL